MMDQAVIKYYRSLLRSGFENAGTIENPSIILDPVAEGSRRICGRPADYLKIYINIRDDTIEAIKYLCLCDPTVNVAVEALCNLLRGKTLEEAASIKKEAIMEAVGSDADELGTKANALLDILNLVLIRYQDKLSQNREKK
jgi:NifU-like protein involved in Fe-S cluster formation